MSDSKEASPTDIKVSEVNETTNFSTISFNDMTNTNADMYQNVENVNIEAEGASSQVQEPQALEDPLSSVQTLFDNPKPSVVPLQNVGTIQTDGKESAHVSPEMHFSELNDTELESLMHERVAIIDKLDDTKQHILSQVGYINALDKKLDIFKEAGVSKEDVPEYNRLLEDREAAIFISANLSKQSSALEEELRGLTTYLRHHSSQVKKNPSIKLKMPKLIIDSKETTPKDNDVPPLIQKGKLLPENSKIKDFIPLGHGGVNTKVKSPELTNWQQFMNNPSLTSSAIFYGKQTTPLFTCSDIKTPERPMLGQSQQLPYGRVDSSLSHPNKIDANAISSNGHIPVSNPTNQSIAMNSSSNVNLANKPAIPSQKSRFPQASYQNMDDVTAMLNSCHLSLERNPLNSTEQDPRKADQIKTIHDIKISEQEQTSPMPNIPSFPPSNFGFGNYRNQVVDSDEDSRGSNLSLATVGSPTTNTGMNSQFSQLNGIHTKLQATLRDFSPIARPHLHPQVKSSSHFEGNLLHTLRSQFQNKFELFKTQMLQADAQRSIVATTTNKKLFREAYHSYQNSLHLASDIDKHLRSLDRDISENIALQSRYRSQIKVPEISARAAKLDLTEITRCIEICGNTVNPASNFAQTFRKLSSYGQARNFNEENYKQALDILLSGSLYDTYHSMRSHPLGEIVQKLTDRYVTDQSIATYQRQLRNFQREPNEPLQVTMARLETLLNKTQALFPAEHRETRCILELTSAVQKLCSSGAQSKLSELQSDAYAEGTTLPYSKLLQRAIACEEALDQIPNFPIKLNSTMAAILAIAERPKISLKSPSIMAHKQQTPRDSLYQPYPSPSLSSYNQSFSFPPNSKSNQNGTGPNCPGFNKNLRSNNFKPRNKFQSGNFNENVNYNNQQHETNSNPFSQSHQNNRIADPNLAYQTQGQAPVGQLQGRRHYDSKYERPFNINNYQGGYRSNKGYFHRNNYSSQEDIAYPFRRHSYQNYGSNKPFRRFYRNRGVSLYICQNCNRPNYDHDQQYCNLVSELDNTPQPHQHHIHQ